MIHFDRAGNGAIAPASLVDPQKKRENGRKLRAERRRAAAASEPMKFVKEIYGPPAVKRQLSRITYGKCSYCDRRVSRQHGDIDHFRPKARYWWLGYSWENLLLTCLMCNRSFKGASFPVRSTRATGPRSNLNDEQHLLINPLDEDPEPLIGYDFASDRILVVPRDNRSTERVEACVRLYGLNDEDLSDDRRERYQQLRFTFSIYDTPGVPRTSKNSALHQLTRLAEDRSEFAGMTRYCLDSWGLPR